MKNKKIVFVLLFLFIFTLFLGFFSLNVAGASTLTYTFEGDNFYNTTDPDYHTGYNVRNPSEIVVANLSDTTFSFTNYTTEEDLDIYEVHELYVQSGGTVYQISVQNEVAGHDKVLDVWDNDNSEYVGAYISLGSGAQEYGSYEFWFRSTAFTSAQLQFGMNEAHLMVVNMRVDGGKFQYRDSGSTWHDIVSADTNIWYHIKIDYECGVGGYLGLGADRFYISFNGVRYGDYDMYSHTTNIHCLRVGYWTTATGHIYIDGVGTSWDSDYNLGDNFMPNVSIDTTIQEVDKYEFAFEGFQDQYDEGSDIFSNWTEIDTHDTVNIDTDPLFMTDRRIYVSALAPETHDLGIEKEFYIQSGIINVSWGVEFDTMDALPEYRTKIYSYDDTLISHIYITNGWLRYSSGGLVDIASGLTTGEVYEFNLLIDYANELTLLSFYTDYVYIDTYIIQTANLGKDGLGKIECYIEHSAINDMELWIDYVGVYVNGSSITEEFGYRRIKNIVTNDYYYLHGTNLFSFNAIGNLSFWVSKYNYFPFVSTIAQICPLDLYNGSYLFNTISIDDWAPFHFIFVPMLWIQFYNEFELINITIDGIRVVESDNVYYLEISSSGVDDNENYFYVDEGSNVLRFTLTVDDGNLEYIQMRLNIPGLPIVQDLSSENRSVLFKSNIIGSSLGYMRINYTDDTSTYLAFPSHLTTTSLILPQTKSINDLIILITDEDASNSDFCSGYITNLQLVYIPDISLTITMVSLLAVMIPLMILLIPTFAMYKKFGEIAIIPMFMLMSIICLVASLIEVWLFFILMFGSVIMLFTKKKIEVL